MGDWDKVLSKNKSLTEKLNLPDITAKQKVMIYDVDCPYSMDIINIQPVFNSFYGMHGTWAAQVVKAINPNVIFYGSRFEEPEKVIDYCIANGIRIISASINFGYSDAREAALKKFYDWGGIFVTSAGNSGSSGVKYPGSSPYTICVSATNSEDCNGPEIDVTADSYWTVRNKGAGMFTPFNGTSCSVPVIAGCITYILERHTHWKCEEVRNFLRENSTPLSEEFERFFSFPEGFGDTMHVKIDFPYGKDYILVNGEKVQMDCKVTADNGRLKVPIRYIGNALGFAVSYDEKTQTGTIEGDVYKNA